MILKAYKYRIYPTIEQTKFLNQNFGSVRFLWNKLVENWNNYDTENFDKSLSEKTLKDQEEYSWMKRVISYALQQKRLDFVETKKQFFNKKRKTKIGSPKFKKRGNRESFRIPAQALSSKLIDYDSSRIFLPKIKSGIKIVLDRTYDGKVKSVTVSKNPSGQFFISILVEETGPINFPSTGKSVGIDLGLKEHVTTSDGQKFSSPKALRKNQARLKRIQQALSRKKKGSKRRNKARIKVAKLHQKISDIRKHHNNVLSKCLVSEYDFIALESLNVAGMVKNHCLAKSISDAGWSQLVTMIDYKSKWYGKTMVKIDRFFPSSKTCSCCGHKMKEMDLSVRDWRCAKCGATHDRDVNAAINILDEGFRKISAEESPALNGHRKGNFLDEIPATKCLDLNTGKLLPVLKTG